MDDKNGVSTEFYNKIMSKCEIYRKAANADKNTINNNKKIISHDFKLTIDEANHQILSYKNELLNNSSNEVPETD